MFATMLKTLMPPALSLLLLAGALTDNPFRSAPPEVQGYHDSIRQAGKNLPMDIGEWTGQDSQVEPAAVALLKPNLVLNRGYRNSRTGMQAQVLVVQCRDARDMLGHYPPVCYPAQGWTIRESNARQWTIAGATSPLRIDGQEYNLGRHSLGQSTRQIVCDFMILPNGKLCTTMDEVRRSASESRLRFYGAAQIQVVMDGGLAQEQRDTAFVELLTAYRPLIDAIRQGVTQ